MTQATLIRTGETVTVVEVNGGWTTVELFGGETKKVRNSDISKAFTPSKEVKVTKAEHKPIIVRAEKPAKEPKPPKAAKEPKAPAPKREPAPAHFIGEVASGKVVKIKNTEADISHYFVSDVKTAAGRRTIDCNDEIAEVLRGEDLEQVYQITAIQLEVSVEQLKSQYGHLNIGMQRMNLGNRIRGAAAAREKAAAKAVEDQAKAEAAQIKAAAKAKKDAKALQAKADRADAREAAKVEKAEKKAAAKAK